jgi:hypothetical protein
MILIVYSLSGFDIKPINFSRESDENDKKTGMSVQA